jgi:hypothetical protein
MKVLVDYSTVKNHADELICTGIETDSGVIWWIGEDEDRPDDVINASEIENPSFLPSFCSQDDYFVMQ